MARKPAPSDLNPAHWQTTTGRRVQNTQTGEIISRRQWIEHIGPLASSGKTLEQRAKENAPTRPPRKPRARPQQPVQAPTTQPTPEPVFDREELRPAPATFVPQGWEGGVEFEVPDEEQESLPAERNYGPAWEFIAKLPNGDDKMFMVDCYGLTSDKYKDPGIEVWRNVSRKLDQGATLRRPWNMSIFERIYIVAVVWTDKPRADPKRRQ